MHDLDVKKHDELYDATKLLYRDLFNFPKKMRVNLQEVDDTSDLTFYELPPNIPEADIIDEQGKPLHPISATDILMNAEVLLPQGEE